MTANSLEIGPPQDGDFPAWRQLYQGYADFYEVPMTDEIAATVWAWFRDSSHPMEALIARQGGQPVGLAHYRSMPRPLRGAEIGFLDDLFVDPASRGNGIGEKLLQALMAIGEARGWRHIRWLTQDHNYRARSLYDRFAVRSMLLTYEMDIGPSEP